MTDEICHICMQFVAGRQLVEIRHREMDNLLPEYSAAGAADGDVDSQVLFVAC